MKNNDYVSKIIDCCKKREEILRNNEPMWKYNKYFDRMRIHARKLIDENRQEELLPYLEIDSISIRKDVAGLLFHSYPELCTPVLQEIADMTVKTGLPLCFTNCSTSAYMTLKYGIPKDYP